MRYNYAEMLNKEIVNHPIGEMPNEFTADKLIGRRLVVEKVNQGLQEVEEGKIITEEELDQQMTTCFA